MRAATYSVLLSLEPAIAALTGFVLVGQTLSGLDVTAIVAVMIAAGGASCERGVAPRSRASAARRRRAGLTDRPGRRPGVDAQIPVSTAILPALIALSRAAWSRSAWLA